MRDRIETSLAVYDSGQLYFLGFLRTCFLHTLHGEAQIWGEEGCMGGLGMGGRVRMRALAGGNQ